MACVPEGSGVRSDSLPNRACGSNPPRRDCHRESGAARQTSVFHPRPLSWPERHPFDVTRIDDKARWLTATARYLVLVERLCRKERTMFPAHKYAAKSADGLRERVVLLVKFGGLPEAVACLNSVPAEVLEEAVEAFAGYFGLEGAESGHLAGAGTVPAMLDPTPHNRGTVEVLPW